jgi:hypothetical protein
LLIYTSFFFLSTFWHDLLHGFIYLFFFCYITFQLQLLKLATIVEDIVSKDIKDNMYNMIVEGFQLLNRWTSCIWEQCAWKFSRPCKDASPIDDDQTEIVSDYEKV